jgi:hypothetical protein
MSNYGMLISLFIAFEVLIEGIIVPGSMWYYAPNKIAPIIFIVLFFVSGGVHVWQMA